MQQEVWLMPGVVEAYDIDVWATCHTLQTGHRLRVDISSSASPKFDTNMNTGGVIGRETTGIPADQTVYHDRARPSQVVIPVIP